MTRPDISNLAELWHTDPETAKKLADEYNKACDMEETQAVLERVVIFINKRQRYLENAVIASTAIILGLAVVLVLMTWGG